MTNHCESKHLAEQRRSRALVQIADYGVCVFCTGCKNF